jgi:TonB family protein
LLNCAIAFISEELLGNPAIVEDAYYIMKKSLEISNVFLQPADRVSVVKYHGGIMEPIHFCLTNSRSRRVLIRLMQTAALTLVVLLASQAHADGLREVQSRVAPVYPEIAKRMRISGTVEVAATVDPNGKVKDAKAVSGNHVLSTAAEAAVLRWKFEPGTSDSTVNVQVNFSLSE